MKCSEISKLYKGFEIEFDEDLSSWWVEIDKEVVSNTDLTIIKEVIDKIVKITPIKAFYFDVDCNDCGPHGDITYCIVVEKHDSGHVIITDIDDDDNKLELNIDDVHPRNDKNTKILKKINDLENKINKINEEIDNEIDNLDKLRFEK